ncbi:hypothetical protein BDZ89DRAFT_1163150 [Hymenopellis radicata]|nr:hypothetical protein BDZ89DRAFT_1163150 [Hymenopellis radicata]
MTVMGLPGPARNNVGGDVVIKAIPGQKPSKEHQALRLLQGVCSDAKGKSRHDLRDIRFILAVLFQLSPTLQARLLLGPPSDVSRRRLWYYKQASALRFVVGAEERGADHYRLGLCGDKDQTMEIGRLAEEYSKISLSRSMSAQVEKAVCMLEMHQETIRGNGTDSDPETMLATDTNLKLVPDKLRKDEWAP